eukprot:6198633-Pleurochrysis_carterae.AAC.2
MKRQMCGPSGVHAGTQSSMSASELPSVLFGGTDCRKRQHKIQCPCMVVKDSMSQAAAHP